MTLETMSFGAFFGLIAAVAIYHLLMYAILRVPEFLSYGAYLLAFAIFQFGREPQFLGVFGIEADADADIVLWWSFSALALLGYWLFCSFLMLRARQPRLEAFFSTLRVCSPCWRCSRLGSRDSVRTGPVSRGSRWCSSSSPAGHSSSPCAN